jgi:hypothetical protein
MVVKTKIRAQRTVKVKPNNTDTKSKVKVKLMPQAEISFDKKADGSLFPTDNAATVKTIEFLSSTPVNADIDGGEF